MQQMNPEETRSEWQHTYDGYQGTPQYSDSFGGVSGQKLHVDEDEQFADLLARKIKQDLKDEMRPAGGPSAGQRLLLAIVSLCVLIPIFGLFSVTLFNGGSATPMPCLGVFAACFVIISVNALFNNFFAHLSEKEKRK